MEDFGTVPQTQLQFARAKLTVRLVNRTTTKTAATLLSASDFNVLLRQDGAPIQVDAVLPKSNISKTIDLTAVLPPPQSQTPGDAQFAQWHHQYDDLCGVDLRVALTWRGPPEQAPLNDREEAVIYQGAGNSRPWDEGAPPKLSLCGGSTCVSLSKVAQSICRQLRGRVVGYAFEIGTKEVHRRGAYGLARTQADPPAAAFTPSTQMQIASASKVLTALATVSVMGTKIGQTAESLYPSNWALPADGIAKKIKVLEFVSQKSDVQQYYAGPNGQDFDSLKAFFTQPIKDPDAARTCPGPPAPAQTNPPKPAVPALLPNPIITDHTACYTDTNFGIMRLLLPRFAATSSNDPATLANSYVKIVQDKVLKPVSVSAPPASPTGPTALPYSLNPGQPGWAWGDLTNVCGDWGWFLSVEDYFKVLTSLASGDGKIISNCQLRDMETNHALADPSQFLADHGIGWDLTTATLPGAKDPIRWLEKNGADGHFESGKGGNQTTSVVLFGGDYGFCQNKLPPPIAAVLYINSNVDHKAADTEPGADVVLQQAIFSASSSK